MKAFKFTLLIIPLLIFACSGNNYTEYRVSTLYDTIKVYPGSESYMVIKAELPPKNHIYGNPVGPGIGKATEIFIKKNPNFIFKPTRYLPPEKFYTPGDKEYTWAYGKETYFFVPFSVSKKSKPATHDINITFDSLLCDDSTCTPEIFQFTTTISIVPESSTQTIFDKSINDKFLLAKAPEAGATSVKKFDSSLYNKTKTYRDQLKDISFKPIFFESGISGILQALLFGIIAGIILNFMPCVLPVVSLKVMSFINHADKSRKELFLLGSLFSAGILVSFTILAMLAAFFGYNWGGLFQHPVFLIVMIAIVFALALSMFDVFTINAPSISGKPASDIKNHYIDAFTKGLLATLLATPCSGPFLGGTLAWALSQPPVIIFIIFMSVGFGMALPYLLLTINPRFLKFVPRPGEWMKTFERIMGFFLVFTAVYLLAILEAKFVMPAITFLGFISIGLWQFGKYGAIFQSKVKRIISILLLIVITVSGYFISFEYLFKTNEKAVTIQSSELDIARILENRKNGKISIIKFTADWCPNCKLVEKLSLYTDGVKKAIIENNGELIIADITRKNPAAENLMKKFNSHSIPILAVIPPGKKFTEPYVLRDIYSEKDVIKALSLAAEGSDKKQGPSVKYKFEVPDITTK